MGDFTSGAGFDPAAPHFRPRQRQRQLGDGFRRRRVIFQRHRDVTSGRGDDNVDNDNNHNDAECIQLQREEE